MWNVLYVSWNLYLWIRDLFYFAFIFLKECRKKETEPNLVTILLTAWNCLAVPEVNKKKKNLLSNIKENAELSQQQAIFFHSLIINSVRCYRKQMYSTWIDKSIKTSGLFALAKKQTEKYSVCGWSQTVLVIVSFTRNHAAFSGPLALSTNTLWKLATESERLAEELSIWGEEEHKTLTVFSV